MKLISKNLDKSRAGYIRLSADDTEDIWHLYNLISAGDSVRSTTVRNNTTGSITGSTKTERSRTTLTLAVEYVECDTQADLLRVRGRNIVENPYVPLGHYHTLDVRPNMLVQIQKPEWDALALDRVREACDPAAGVDLAAVCMQDGLAHVCLIRSSLTLQRAKIEMAVPRKRRGMTEQHDKGMRKFNEAVLQAIVRHIDFAVVKCVLIASPGFVKDQFFAYLTQRATELRVLADNRDKFVLVHASSGYTTELPAVLQQPAIAERVAGTMAAGEVLALRRFYELLQTDEARAWYGKAHVLRAAQEDAIETLLISDNLFRSADVGVRKEYIQLVERVRESGGEVKIFSSMHATGEQLAQLSGVAAMLRWPMAELEDETANGEQVDDSDDD